MDKPLKLFTQAIIFDMDGVLIDSEHVNIQAAVGGFQSLGYALNEEETRHVVGRHESDFVPEFAKKHDISRETQRQIVMEIDRLYGELWPKLVQLNPLAAPVLTQLKKRGLRLALATSSNRKIVDRFLLKLNIGPIFEHVLTFEDVTRRKPNPDIYIKAQQRLQLKAEQNIVVEDTNVGVRAAKSAGLRCIAIPNEHTHDQDFSMADIILDSLQEIPNVVILA